MGGLSIWHWIIVGGVVFVLFGGKFKISDVMTDVAKGIKAFKKGMAEDDTTASAADEAPRSVENLPREHAALDKASDPKKL
jgi:sec-independent protein translocase protein TatA